MTKYLPLVWKDLTRKKVRTLFTALAILVAFFLFGLLGAVEKGFTMGIDLVGVDRLVTIHKVSIIQPLPERYAERIAATPGVADVSWANWFGGVYQDPKNFFAQIAVESESFLRLYPEYVLSDAQRAAWMADRQGAIAGRSLVERFGWKIGDRIPIQATIWRTKDGTDLYEFNLRGIYDPAEPGVDDTQFFFHYEYLDEMRAGGDGLVGWFILRVEDPDRSAEIAQTIDEAFANSSAETKTSTEKAFMQAFANQVGDIGAIVAAILGAVFFTILLVAGNTMAQSVRERIAELAVLKTLGFSDLRVMLLVLAESLAVAVVGGGLGLALAWMVIQGGDPTGGFLPSFYLPSDRLLVGAGFVLLLGVVSGLLPALTARRLSIVEALRRV